MLNTKLCPKHGLTEVTKLNVCKKCEKEYNKEYYQIRKAIWLKRFKKEKLLVEVK